MSGRTCIDCGAPISETSRGRCVACGHAPLLRKMPADFVSVLRRLGSSQLAARHYRASLTAVTRWRREADLLPHRPAVRVSRTGRLNRGSFGMSLRAPVTQRDMTEAGRAADFLQRFGPVFRCLTTGKAHPKGTYWNRNGHVLSDREIVARAERLGFRPGGL